METIIFAVLPVAVMVITSILKKIPAISTIDSQGWRSATIRFIAALLSFGGVVGLYMGTGTPIDPMAVETFVLAFLTFLGSLGAYQVSHK